MHRGVLSSLVPVDGSEDLNYLWSTEPQAAFNLLVRNRRESQNAPHIILTSKYSNNSASTNNPSLIYAKIYQELITFMLLLFFFVSFTVNTIQRIGMMPRSQMADINADPTLCTLLVCVVLLYKLLYDIVVKTPPAAETGEGFEYDMERGTS